MGRSARLGKGAGDLGQLLQDAGALLPAYALIDLHSIFSLFYGVPMQLMDLFARLLQTGSTAGHVPRPMA